MRTLKNTSDESKTNVKFYVKCLCRIPLCHFGGEGVKIFYRKIFSDKMSLRHIFGHKGSRWVYEGSAAAVKI
jgi:hypothetical protein